MGWPLRKTVAPGGSDSMMKRRSTQPPEKAAPARAANASKVRFMVVAPAGPSPRRADARQADALRQGKGNGYSRRVPGGQGQPRRGSRGAGKAGERNPVSSRNRASGKLTPAPGA